MPKTEVKRIFPGVGRQAHGPLRAGDRIFVGVSGGYFHILMHWGGVSIVEEIFVDIPRGEWHDGSTADQFVKLLAVGAGRILERCEEDVRGFYEYRVK